MILLMYRHGLRVAELVRLRWDMVDLKAAVACPARQTRAALHPLRGVELRALRQLQSEAAGMAYLFVSERGGPLTTRAVHRVVAEAGRAASLPFPVHPTCCGMRGFYLANKGVDTRALQQYLGHGTSNIQFAILS